SAHLCTVFRERGGGGGGGGGRAPERAALGARGGVTFLVARGELAAARRAAAWVRDSGIANERIVYLPMRGRDTPTPAEMATVAGGAAFQSMSCLMACGRSERFCSVGWDKRVAGCSYTVAPGPLPELSYRGL